MRNCNPKVPSPPSSWSLVPAKDENAGGREQGAGRFWPPRSSWTGVRYPERSQGPWALLTGIPGDWGRAADLVRISYSPCDVDTGIDTLTHRSNYTSINRSPDLLRNQRGL